MSLLGSMVGLANSLTQNLGLQADVTYYPYVASDGAGKRSYGPAQARKALYTRKMKLVRSLSGEMVMSTAQVVFLDPTTINELDKIVLPDGSTQPILTTDAFVDGSNSPILTEIFLGDSRQI